MKEISAENLKKEMEAGKEITVINVLPEDYYADCHIKGSININHNSEQWNEEVANWDKDRYIVVYCAHSMCSASQDAAKKLAEMGFTNVFAYEGGMKEWRQKGFPCNGECGKDYLTK